MTTKKDLKIFIYRRQSRRLFTFPKCSLSQYFEEGDCIQIMHIGSYDDEPATIKLMDSFALNNGCQLDFSETRLHHEIYLSDPRKTPPEKLRTVIRHPIKRV